MKNSYPVQLENYEVKRHISGKPFSWWTHNFLRKHNQIIERVEYVYWVCPQFFLVNIFRFVVESKSFDEDNGNTIMWGVICKETKNTQP